MATAVGLHSYVIEPARCTTMLSLGEIGGSGCLTWNLLLHPGRRHKTGHARANPGFTDANTEFTPARLLSPATLLPPVQPARSPYSILSTRSTFVPPVTPSFIPLMTTHTSPSLHSPFTLAVVRQREMRDADPIMEPTTMG